MTDQAKATSTKRTKKKSRGPNYPSIGLDKAVEFAQTLYEHERRNAVPVAVALRHWGYKNAKSSTATMALAALRSYGLLDFIGKGSDRQAKLSDRALQIVLKTPNRDEALKEAALSPKIHKVILGRFKADGLPSDSTLRHRLIMELDFNDDAVDSFLARFRSTLALAKLTESDTISGESGDTDGNNTPVAVGDLIQWNSDGIAQFPTPQKVVSLSDDGLWAFVEGSPTGISVSEVTVVGRVAEPSAGKAVPMVSNAPQNPLFKPHVESKQDTFALRRGQILVQWPETMGDDEIADVEAWFPILLRKIKRSVATESES